MVLYLPDLNTLQLALTSGAIPPALGQAPVIAGLDDDGHVWLEPSVSVTRAAQADLKKLGAVMVKRLEAPSAVELSCWPQILPLQREVQPTTPTPTTPVLFELPSSKELPALVGEMVRLGNDRQGFRYLGDDEKSPALLRVIGPPYYTLLRALDRDGSTGAPRAYLERAPRVWVEVGHTHPLVGKLKAPPGRLLLLRPPRDWLYLEEAPFRDIYEILEFSLPSAETRWRGGEGWTEKITVPVRLTGGAAMEAAQMWVLRDNAVDTLDEFVRNSDDDLLRRLDFAVAEGQGKDRVIILRVRPPIRTAPPVLVLPGRAYRPFVKLPNLFLPLGQALHPPLRRDAVRKLLADDPDVITWLHPQGDGTFTPESLPDNVFRPLPDWIDYVLDHDHAALQAWMGSTLFQFDEWICKDEKEPSDRPKKEPAERDPSRSRKDLERPAPPSGAGPRTRVAKAQSADDAEQEALPELPKAQKSELQKKAAALEKRFLDLEGGLDAPARSALWPELALLYHGTEKDDDAAVCWSHALWEESAESSKSARTWFHHQAQRPQPGAFNLDQLLNKKEPSLADVRSIAACVVAAAHQDPPPHDVAERLRSLQEYLQRQESLLPVRIVWLVALAFYQMSHGDLLALTRTRDRLLERLFKTGLTTERDLPTFLRFSGVRASDRFRAFRDWLTGLPEKTRKWIHNNPVRNTDGTSNAALTEAYAHCILAFGLARLGEERMATDLQRAARRALDGHGEIPRFLLDALGFRITQALDGKPPTGPLPRALMATLETMSRLDRYVIDRLREKSRILEPHQKIDPYRTWKSRYDDELGQRLAELPDTADRTTVERTITDLLARTKGKSKEDREARSRVIAAGLTVAPRVGEEFARALLAEAPAAFEASASPMDAADLLEKSLFVAAHFDQSAYVQEGVKLFQTMLERLHEGPAGAGVLDSLAAQCFRGLRKLGLRDEIHALLARMAAVVTGGKSYRELRGLKEWPGLLRTLLHVASGWFYFGMDADARSVLEEARALLYRGKLEVQAQKRLACAYAATLGQAPVDLALQCIDEMLAKLTRIADSFTTNAHYSLSQLEVIEAMVLAVVTEDFALGSAARRWLDDEEFLIRRRIHGDVHALLGQAHL